MHNRRGLSQDRERQPERADHESSQAPDCTFPSSLASYLKMHEEEVFTKPRREEPVDMRADAAYCVAVRSQHDHARYALPVHASLWLGNIIGPRCGASRSAYTSV